MMSEMKNVIRSGDDETEATLNTVATEVSDGDVESKALIPSTVRFSREADTAFRTLSDDYNVSKAEIIRLAAAGGLAKYLGEVKYVDRKQGAAINNNISELANVMFDIAEQLRRIGVNYNQQIKLKNIERKRAEMKAEFNFDLDSISRHSVREKELDEQEKAIRNDSGLLDTEKLQELMNQYEEASRKVSEILWRIRE